MKRKHPQKGSNTEREIAKKLSLWWTSGERDDIFWRASQSGGRATQRAKKGDNTHNSAGDICYLDAIGKPLLDYAVIEIKRGYNSLLDVLSIVDAKPSKKPMVLLQWYKKAEEEANFNKRQGVFIIIRRDRKEYCIAMDYETYWRIGDKNKNIKYAQVIAIQSTFVMMPLQQFFDWCSPDFIKEFNNGN